jgi:predicted nucleic acid-binding protein
LFANRFTVFVDACSLVSVLRRNLLLSLAEAEFFRIRWSEEVLDEMEKALTHLLTKRGHSDASERAKRARKFMTEAFEEAMVLGYSDLMNVTHLPDATDNHVLAAAIKTQAFTLVTENLRHFPENILRGFNLEARSADVFIADTIDLDPLKATEVIKRMRKNFKRPEVTADDLLLKMEADGLLETVIALKPYVQQL